MIKHYKKYRLLIRTMAVLLLLIISFSVYVVIANRNTKQMTIRQKILNAFYPALMRVGKNKSLAKTKKLPGTINPQVSFYSLHANLVNGKPFDFARLKGKKVLLVNTASACGYTGQYEELEKLFRTYQDRLMVLAFPSNEFKQQETGSNEEIEKFCKLNFGISFPLMQKNIVLKKPGQQDVYKWLTDATRNGWNDQQPEWNFSKYLVNEEGILTNYFPPGISPLDKVVTAAITDDH